MMSTETTLKKKGYKAIPMQGGAHITHNDVVVASISNEERLARTPKEVLALIKKRIWNTPSNK